MYERATIADLERRLAAAGATLHETAQVQVALRQSEELRRIAVERLRESEAGHRLPIERGAQAVWETDASGVVVADSPSWRAYTGQTLAEWLGYGWLDAIHPQDRAYAERQWREALAVQGFVDAEFRLRAPDGGWRWTNVRATPVLNAEGGIEKWTGLNLDIEARRRADIALRQIEERQQFLLALSDELGPLSSDLQIARAAATRLCERLDVDRVFYGEIEGDRLMVEQDSTRDVPSIMGEHSLTPFGPHFLAAYRAGAVIQVDGIETDPRIPEAARAGLRERQVAAFTDVVLLEDERQVALFGVQSAAPRAWTPRETDLIREVAERVRSAVKRARAEAALRETKEALAADLADTELLRGLAEHLVTEENVRAIYDEVLSAAIVVARADAGTIQTYDPGAKSLELLTAKNFSRTVEDYFQTVDASSRTACGIALNTGQRTFVDFPDEVADPGCLLLVDEGLKSALALPLRSRTGTPLGMLNTHWRRPRYRPTEKQLRFLELIARQAADLIEQRQAQSALRGSEERLRQFGEASQDVLWIRNAESLQWIYLTPAFETIYGLDREAALAGDNMTGWLDLIVPEDRQTALDSIRQVLAGERVSFECRIQRPCDGRLRWLRNTDFPMHGPAGQVCWIGGVGRDITEEKASAQRQEVLGDDDRFLLDGEHGGARLLGAHPGIRCARPFAPLLHRRRADAVALGQRSYALFTELNRATDCLRRGGASMENLAHSASLAARWSTVPPHRGIRHPSARTEQGGR